MFPPFPEADILDLKGGLSFFGQDAALYRRFLRRFPQDDSFPLLKAALERGDVSEAFLRAHTLKGLARQLGLSGLSAPAEALCELLRPLDPAALPRAGALFPTLEAAYLRTVDALRLL